ncbi:jg13694 [Pararge aegeria aegeria]|uniref:Jg13694 protein n=1 Tax=Pararge aegeria aegeria TaxID=348720 RepID=A0A8S4RRS1_9NEOP|nr:jg13694 [Pararge aegeria aegeria]
MSILQTQISIATRVTLQKQVVRDNDPQKAAIAEHILQGGTQHWLQLHDPKVLSTDHKDILTLVRDVIEIRKYKNFNREDKISECVESMQTKKASYNF